MSKKESIFGSFEYAASGVRDAFRDEPNFRVHVFVGVIAFALAFFFGFTPLEFAILILVEALVFISEMVNTVLEELVDIVSPERREEARKAKDVSAAFVMISALSSALVGLLLFLPKIFQYVSF